MTPKFFETSELLELCCSTKSRASVDSSDILMVADENAKEQPSSDPSLSTGVAEETTRSMRNVENGQTQKIMHKLIQLHEDLKKIDHLESKEKKELHNTLLLLRGEVSCKRSQKSMTRFRLRRLKPAKAEN